MSGEYCVCAFTTLISAPALINALTILAGVSRIGALCPGVRAVVRLEDDLGGRPGVPVVVGTGWGACPGVPVVGGTGWEDGRSICVSALSLG